MQNIFITFETGIWATYVPQLSFNKVLAILMAKRALGFRVDYCRAISRSSFNFFSGLPTLVCLLPNFTAIGMRGNSYVGEGEFFYRFRILYSISINTVLFFSGVVYLYTLLILTFLLL
jgi:hypothetical protein